ncbi:YceI family protein [Caulobacter sp. S45]|uniref:YceI family protein n=1 Tax=Caulobacter sp. S45 TaxID=1641861 RepID=UPI00131B709D|nr:YceI family protein [Caulobacter sp. S45]
MSHHKPLAVLSALALLTLASATQAGPANPDPAAVKGGSYVIEPHHTRVLFSVSHMGFTTWYGDFAGASGKLTLDAAHPEASQLQVSIPTASVSTTNATLDGELKSGDWFDAAKYPTITFNSTSVRPTGAGEADVSGDLTFHGVTKPVSLHVHFNGAGRNPIGISYIAGFEVSGHLKRSDFGVTKYAGVIGDDVTLIVSAAFERKGG